MPNILHTRTRSLSLSLSLSFVPRNKTYAALAAGRFANIRTYKREQMISGGAQFDGNEVYVLPPLDLDPPSGALLGWRHPTMETIDDFSGACWYVGKARKKRATRSTRGVCVCVCVCAMRCGAVRCVACLVCVVARGSECIGHGDT